MRAKAFRYFNAENKAYKCRTRRESPDSSAGIVSCERKKERKRKIEREKRTAGERWAGDVDAIRNCKLKQKAGRASFSRLIAN